jgi:hypothetical protein
MNRNALLAKKTQNLLINNDIQKYYLSSNANKFTYLQHLNLQGKINTDSSYLNINWTLSFKIDSKRDQLIIFKNSLYYPRSYLIPEEIDLIDQTKKYFFKEEKSSSGAGIHLELNNKVGLAQESIEPFLYKNRKIDNRIYVIISKINNIDNCYIYNEILVRSSQNFYLELSKNKLTQITNTAALTSDNSDENQYLLSNLPFQEIFMCKIKEVVRDIYQIILQKNSILNNTFNMYGFDIIIDKNCQPFLLEINSNPNFIKSLNTNEIKQMKLNMLNDLIYNLLPCLATQKYNLIKNFIKIY